MHVMEFGRLSNMGMGGGFNIVSWIAVVVIAALVIAATIIAIMLLINSARSRGVEVRGGKLASFWIVGICLTPIMLALYVLTLKPRPRMEGCIGDKASERSDDFANAKTGTSPDGVDVPPSEPLQAAIGGSKLASLS